MKKKTLVTVLLGLLIITPFTHAVNTTTDKGKSVLTKEQQATSDKAVKSVEQQQNALLEEVNQGALEGYEKVLKATKLLTQEAKEKEAIALLQEATGKFDLALAADPTLKLVPIDGDISITALVATPELIRKETDVAVDLLKNHKIQTTRALLEPLKDEMVVSAAYLPMGTYPDAIKRATNYLLDNKKEDAVATLATALSTIVIKKSVIPLAIIRTESFLKEAADLDKNKAKDKVHALLEAAEGQLEIATLLGYTSENSTLYDDLKKQIKALKKEIKGDNAVEKMYKKIKESVKHLIGKEGQQS
ncbi:MAG TPA: YfdX family protein [Crenotrichaceae bacterium]|nr:YfdX family protein [Crenotrichaceae bacterium]